MKVWCSKCGSDEPDLHYGGCPDHPNNKALGQRMSGRPMLNEAIKQANNPVRQQSTGRSDWFSAPTEMAFSPDQLKRVFEHFLLNVLDLNVEVTDIKASTAKGAKVTFKQRPEVQATDYLPGDELSEEELIALNAVKDEMVSDGNSN